MSNHSDNSVRPSVQRSDSGSIVEDTAVARHCDQGDSIVVDTIETVADLTDQRVDEIDPLHSVLDPDALEMILEPTRQAEEIRVSFEYEGCQVTVSNTGELVVDPAGTDG